jgi:prepilin-type N-terminal cleavage/methylation domain-containing protein
MIVGHKKNTKGFTLLEVIAVIVIITIGLLSALALASSVVSVPQSSVNRLTAAAIAQNEIENLRWLRDKNFLEGKTWGDYIGSVACTSSVSSSGLINRVNFTKTVDIDCSNTDQVIIKVTVEWSYKNINNKLGPLEYWLYNWK